MLIFPPSSDAWGGKNPTRLQRRINSCTSAINAQRKKIKEYFGFGSNS